MSNKYSTKFWKKKYKKNNVWALIRSFLHIYIDLKLTSLTNKLLCDYFGRKSVPKPQYAATLKD